MKPLLFSLCGFASSRDPRFLSLYLAVQRLHLLTHISLPTFFFPDRYRAMCCVACEHTTHSAKIAFEQFSNAARGTRHDRHAHRNTNPG